MKDQKSQNGKSPLKKSKRSENQPVENSTKKSGKSKSKLTKGDKVFLSFGIIGLIGGIGLGIAGFLLPKATSSTIAFLKIPSKTSTDKIYSRLTGLALTSEADVTAPAYCVQTPNGMDGARPQAGLDQAGVVFEAIAETGITRFAAIYQNPSSAIIGPIRSLRLYYLEWDTPFDCTIVHAGGAPDALAAVSRGYRDLTENYSYMYRGTYGTRRWNNLFTTSAYLAKMNTDRGYGGSDIKGFTRMTPEESLTTRINSLVEEKLVIFEPSSGKTSNLKSPVPDIAINFGRMINFNVRYNYDPVSNTYLRSYASGTPHDVYKCPAEDLGEKNPEDKCTLVQLAPSVVVAMIVPEKRASDNYHEDITTTGSGKAYVFQNGIAIEGTWKKPSVAEQIKFYDDKGNEIELAPGQTFVEAVPTYGSIEY